MSTRKRFTPEQRLEAIRLVDEEGMSIKAAAKRAGCSWSTLKYWHNNHHGVSHDRLQKTPPEYDSWDIVHAQLQATWQNILKGLSSRIEKVLANEASMTDAALKSWVTSLAIATDKLLLLNKQPTSNVNSTGANTLTVQQEQVVRLPEQLQSLLDAMDDTGPRVAEGELKEAYDTIQRILQGVEAA